MGKRVEEVHEESFRRTKFKAEIPMTIETSLYGSSLSRCFQVTSNT